jgi:hypothetical protein
LNGWTVVLMIDMACLLSMEGGGGKSRAAKRRNGVNSEAIDKSIPIGLR